MSLTTKVRLTRAVFIAGFIVTAISVSQMIGPGMSGDAAKVKLWFTLMAAALVVAVLSGIAYYYYRARNRELESLRTSADILTTAGQNLAKQKQPKK